VPLKSAVAVIECHMGASRELNVSARRAKTYSHSIELRGDAQTSCWPTLTLGLNGEPHKALSSHSGNIAGRKN
jgi:hypothetical protein